MPDPETDNGRRLIEEWLPINELSIESIRERAAASALPPVNWLHVWWARRPLAISRAAVAASLLNNSEHAPFYDLMGTHPGLTDEKQKMDAASQQGIRVKQGYSRRRAFTFTPGQVERQWFKDNLATPDPLVLDITAGGGSIPFESGRLGLRTHANDLNPVATLILRATCQWPQQFGNDLLEHYDVVRERFQTRVEELLEGAYAEEPLPPDLVEYNQKYEAEIDNGETERAQRLDQTYLWARSVLCPSCNRIIPLSPNWRLDSKGKSFRLLPNEQTGKCDFKIVETQAEQSSGTVRNAIATCPYPSCGSTTAKGYIAAEAQAGRLGHQLYCVIYRDQWRAKNKSGEFGKRLKTRRGFRSVKSNDDNTVHILRRLEETKPQWDAEDILPNEAVPQGNDNRPHHYGMSPWRKMFSPRQQLAHGYCVQAFRELVDADRNAGVLDDVRRSAWCYVALGLDKLINRNSVLTRWDGGSNKVASTFDSHDFGMKWSYAEMAITIKGLGLDWALRDLRDCISELAEMSGHSPDSKVVAQLQNIQQQPKTVAKPSIVTSESADFLLSVDDQSADAIVFDPPYYDNVSYAELSDFFYVWLKRTAGYVNPEWFTDYLTDKGNEAIASPARFSSGPRGGGSIKQRAYDDYVDRMHRMFAECRRVIKDDGIMTIMFTHKSTDAWDALTIGIIEAGFRITATWPVKTESDVSLNIRDRAAAQSTILLTCRPKTEQTKSSSSWEQVERQVALAVQNRIPELEGYNLNPLDIYLASFGPALEVISNNWPIRRELANPERPNDPFGVTPNDALIVARREVFDARRQRISDLWANNPGDALTEFYILAQDNAGSATIPFDEANMMARCIGLELTDHSIYEKKGSNINLLTGVQRFARGDISPTAPTEHHIDRVHTAIALAESSDVNNAINWCRMQDFAENAAFKGTLEALLLVMKPNDPDMQPARNLWTEMYGEAIPEPEGVQVEMPLGTTASML